MCVFSTHTISHYGEILAGNEGPRCSQLAATSHEPSIDRLCACRSEITRGETLFDGIAREK